MRLLSYAELAECLLATLRSFRNLYRLCCNCKPVPLLCVLC